MKFANFIQVILYIIILGILGFLIGSYFAGIREGARTLPRPKRHPITYNTSLTAIPYDQDKSLNSLIDRWIYEYFGRDRFVLQSTIDIYVKICVNQGNVTPTTKEKLNDIGYYLLVNVLPNIPTVKNPTPPMNWPKITWTSDSWFPLINMPNSWNGASSNFNQYLLDTIKQFRLGLIDMDGSGVTLTETTSIAPGSTGNENANGTTGLPNGGIGNDGLSTSTSTCGDNGMGAQCGNICPTSCFANAFQNSDMGNMYFNINGGDSTSGGGGTNGKSGSAGSSVTAKCNNLAEMSAMQSIKSIYLDNQQVNIVITDVSQTNITIPSPLETKITEWIDQYFDADGTPTEYAIEQFQKYTDNAQPMDAVHENKLRNFIYYFMENIIPGLPTKQRPVSYVEWIPIRWLGKISQ